MRRVSQRCRVSTDRVSSRARSVRFSQPVSRPESTSGAASSAALKPIFFMSFLHHQRSPIGALKSVRGDKHGSGTGKEAETGRNKPAILPVALSTAIGGSAPDFISNKAGTLTASGRAVHNQNRQRATPAERFGGRFRALRSRDTIGDQTGGRHGVSGAVFLFDS